MKSGSGGAKPGGNQVEGILLVTFGLEETAPLVLHETHVRAHVETVQGTSAGGDAGLQGIPGFPGDHVDDAADGIGAVDGRGGALDDFDPLQAADRLAVHVEDAPLDALGAHYWEAVDEDKTLAGIDALDLGFGDASGRAAAGDDSGFLREDVPHRFVSRVVEHPLGDDVHLGGRILDQRLFPGTGDDHDLGVQGGWGGLEPQVGRSALLQVQILSRAVEAGHGRGDLVTTSLRQELESALVVRDLVNLESGVRIPEKHVGSHQDPALASGPFT